MRIVSIEVIPVNVPFFAPIRWSGGANKDWTRLVIKMRTDNGLCGIGETLGGLTTKSLIESEVAGRFLNESPFDLSRILAKTTFIPLYYGKCGLCAIAGLELACWDLMGKAVDRPLCDLIGGKMRTEIPFAAYLYHRNANSEGQGQVFSADDIVDRAKYLTNKFGFKTLKYKGGLHSAEFEIEVMQKLRGEFPDHNLRYDPQAIFSPETSIRIGKQLESLNLEYLEDPCWGKLGMARVGRKIDIPLATNMCIINLDDAAEGIQLATVDIVLGDIFEWGGITNILKLRGICDAFQWGLNYHSAAELGIGTAAYLHVAASTVSLPHALDTHLPEMAGEIIKDGVINLTSHGTMRVPLGPGLGVEIDEKRLEVAAEAFRIQGTQLIDAEDESRQGIIPVKSMI